MSNCWFFAYLLKGGRPTHGINEILQIVVFQFIFRSVKIIQAYFATDTIPIKVNQSAPGVSDVV